MVDAGWFTDPESPTQLRWWDGQRWTEHRHAAMPAAITVPPVEPMPAVVAPIVATSVPTPPNEIYPAPLPLATSYPPPGAVEAAPAASASTPSSTASYWQPAEPKPHSSRNLLLAVLIPVGTLILILIVFICVNIAESATASSPNAAAAPAATPSASSTARPPATDINQPGMSGTFNVVTAGGKTTTASAAFQDEFSHYSQEQMDPHCSPLAYGSPVDGYGPNSNDPVTYYTNFISPSGGTSISGAVQVFPSSSSANSYLDRIKGLVTECAGGVPDGDGSDAVTLAAEGPHITMEQYAWDQSVTTSSRSYTVHSIEWRKGNMVARSWCYQIAGTTDSSDICGQWATEVQFALKNSH